jgi:hypothetical protein
MSTGRPNPRTLDILADPTIRDRAEDATRELQDAARDRQGGIRTTTEPAGSGVKP